ncbi:hypothetical protein TanjilG_19648 [Lupinus angustifolius]|uniref:Uncharacterized protein n=1 Tax=Lupinus angustifolius TaxID=3871 RepID=A0A1J7HZ16_LUPAN|nr:hypothetical protein TanjilG_19648 [Lupinus angustifolius]
MCSQEFLVYGQECMLYDLMWLVRLACGLVRLALLYDLMWLVRLACGLVRLACGLVRLACCLMCLMRGLAESAYPDLLMRGQYEYWLIHKFNVDDL